jgi:4-amino-4-deoxy-L-arabinose transferase-like glycosyltransferase
LNLLLLWLAVGLTYWLGRELFDQRAGWLAALALLVSVPVWQQTLALNGTPLLMVLGLTFVICWLRVERKATESVPWVGLVVLGLAGGGLFLAEYTAGTVMFAALGYAWLRWSGRQRFLALAALTVGFAVVAGPWVVRNVGITGHPMALAAQDPALKAGDSTAEPAVVRATLAAKGPELDARKLANKTLTALQENLKSRIWSGGALWLTAFFVAGALYAFRDPGVNRLRWWVVVAALCALFGQAALNSGEAERPVAVWLSPLIIVFGAGFFSVLLASNVTLSAWPRTAGRGAGRTAGAPSVARRARAAASPFSVPALLPALFQGMKQELARRGAAESHGLMADVPAGLAWCAGVRAWQQPAQMRDFHAVYVRQPIGALLLSPRTLDRPFSVISTRRSRCRGRSPCLGVPTSGAKFTPAC